MKKYIRKLEKNSIIISLFLIALALGLIFKPAELIIILIRLFGIILAGMGIVHIIAYYKVGNEYEMFRYNLIQGIVEVCAGIYFIFRSIVIQNVFPIVIGVWIIYQSALKFQLSFNLKNMDGEGWIPILITAICSLVLGMIIICNPFASSIAITTIVGVVLLISEVLNCFESIWILRNIK